MHRAAAVRGTATPNDIELIQMPRTDKLAQTGTMPGTPVAQAWLVISTKEPMRHIILLGDNDGSVGAAVGSSLADEFQIIEVHDLDTLLSSARIDRPSLVVLALASYDACRRRFLRVPPGGDAYLLSHIIHDWSKEQCLTILGHPEGHQARWPPADR